MPAPAARSDAGVAREGDALVFRGALDRAAAVALWPQLAKATGVQRIVLTNVTTVDSAGLALLAELAAQVRASGGTLAIEGQPAGFTELCAAYRLTPGLEFPA
ncbi:MULTISPECIES: STAS domain-containing protein [unclassified Pseudoxanthomonas]|uniref:STAS domain-containing protein n=1 Tax=unclassified Pseudoxanthomonas TaxID=2645906 RepID=UPI00160A8404|nr:MULTISPECIES: STAS domain-containing protein [unclassified Pseudoxanthomonas]MBB3276277.1 phospholipid transport system transporter-binding protein [Pseudoxanthomonas sp. OG2]MBV7472645.1 STAS domain-containing protein [Pseudoxanthomonas sp. PXM05]